MGITSLQVCMDSSDWLQGPNNCEDGMGMEDCSGMTSPTGDEMLTCSRPLIERRLRPQHEEAQKCPRCESTHTKFCYYNNYSLSQPRYFCKTCRRYWTKGGTLRNIPVGGGCRKNKKVSSKKPSSSSDHPPSLHNLVHVSSSSPPSYDHNANPTALQLAFSDQLHFSSLHAAAGLYGANPYLLDQNPTPIDFMENKYEALLGAHDGFVGNGDGYGGMMAAPPQQNAGFHPFGLSSPIDHGTSGIIESCQRLMLPYHHDDNVDHQHHQQQHRFDQSNDVVEVKPNAKILSLEWHDHQQACNSNAGKDSFGYNFGGLGSWTGLMNGYGSSAANPSLV